MSVRPVVCSECGTPLPISLGAGRPRRYCSDRCRYRARHDRARERAGEPVELPAAAPDRSELVASLTFLVDPAAAPAAPEDQLARSLLELRTAAGSLRRLRSELAPRLAGPAGKLADAVDRELRRSFPEVI